MNQKLPQKTVVLGYHSPTEWVFFPEVVALYDRIVMNEAVFAEVVHEGEHTASLYRTTKADLLKTLVHQGVLQPKEYPRGEVEKEQLVQLVDYFFARHEKSMRILLLYAFDAFIQHEKATLEKLITPDDPHWQDVAGQLPRLEKVKQSLKTGTPLAEFPYQREIALRYFEDAILTPVAFRSGYNPVFQWVVYARFEQFLVQFRRGESNGRREVEKGSQLYVLRSLADILLPFRIIRSPDGIKQVTEKWEAFAGIRQYVASLNERLWNMISVAELSSETDPQDFVNDFNSMLSIRIASINQQILEVDQEIEKERSSLFSRITQLIIATLGSLLPGTAGIGKILDDVYSALVRKHVRKQYPPLSAVFEHERILSGIDTRKSEIRTVSEVDTEYKAVKYWDKC